MKDEEMAEEYVQSIEGDDCVIITDREERKQAFLAGLKAGRPQWHDLRKDPTDLPNNTRQVLCAEKGSGYSVGEYWEKEGGWGEDRLLGEEVIAWCEIPTFDKE